MLSSVLIVLTGLLGQAPLGISEELPYRIIDKNTGEEIRAFITDEEFNGRGTLLNVLLDEPWKDLKDRQKPLRRDAHQIEGRANRLLREEAIREGWLLNGGVEVETVNGSMMWVHREERDYAERASKLVAALGPSPQALDPLPPTSDSASEAPSVGFFSLWGMHLLVIGLSLVVIGLIVRVLMVRGTAGP